MSSSVAVFVFELIEVKHHIALSVQVAFEAFQCDSNHIPVTNPLAGGDLAYLKPELMYQANIFDGEIRSMRSKVDAVFVTIRAEYSEPHLPARFFGEAFPRPPKLARLLLFAHL